MSVSASETSRALDLLEGLPVVGLCPEAAGNWLAACTVDDVVGTLPMLPVAAALMVKPRVSMETEASIPVRRVRLLARRCASEGPSSPGE